MNIDVQVITRDYKKSSKIFAGNRSNQISIKEYDFNQGVIDLGHFDYIVHGATPSTKRSGFGNDRDVYSGTLNATKSILLTVESNKSLPRIVNLSSGAVYEPQTKDIPLRFESDLKNFAGKPSSYAAAKIDTERLFSENLEKLNLRCASPRLFTFFGPEIQLDEHFAIGNFLRDGLNGDVIKIKGSPETTRSYMYPTDLIHWILKCLLNPQNKNLNIGSEKSISMHDLALLISEMTSGKGVTVENQNTSANYYVPSTAIFRECYEVTERTTLETGLLNWIKWLSDKDSSN